MQTWSLISPVLFKKVFSCTAENEKEFMEKLCLSSEIKEHFIIEETDKINILNEDNECIFCGKEFEEPEDIDCECGKNMTLKKWKKLINNQIDCGYFYINRKFEENEEDEEEDEEEDIE